MPDQSESREKVLDVAEQLFGEHGYAGVTLRAIASKLGMKVSSLYYHAPGGKEELFVAVTHRNMARHQAELQNVIQRRGQDWQTQLYDIAHWLLSQPPLDMGRVVHSDLRELSPDNSEKITHSMYLVMEPVERVFAAARAQTGKRMPDPGVLAGVFLTIINGIKQAPEPRSKRYTKQRWADEIIDVLIKGLLAD